MITPYVPNVALPTFNGLIYAEPGVGKTTLCATAQEHPAMRDVLFLNVEGGLLSVAGRGDVKAVDIDSTKELESAFWDIRNGIAQTDSSLYGIRTVVLDSGSELQTLALEEAVSKRLKKKPDSDPNDIFIDEYGQSTAFVRRIIRWFRDLPVNFIVTALPKPIFPPGNNPNAAPISSLPAFTNKLAKQVMGYMDFVWYLYVTDEVGADGQPTGNKIRVLMTQPSGIYQAKTRMPNPDKPWIAPLVANPYLPTIYEMLVGSEKEKASA